jgi:hypothetical protein
LDVEQAANAAIALTIKNMNVVSLYRRVLVNITNCYSGSIEPAPSNRQAFGYPAMRG